MTLKLQNPITVYKERQQKMKEKKEQEKKDLEEKKEQEKKELEKKNKQEIDVMNYYFNETFLKEIKEIQDKKGLKDWDREEKEEKKLENSLNDEKVKQIVSNIYERFKKGPLLALELFNFYS